MAATEKKPYKLGPLDGGGETPSLVDWVYDEDYLPTQLGGTGGYYLTPAGAIAGMGGLRKAIDPTGVNGDGNAINGFPVLDSNKKVAVAQLPTTIAYKDAANAYTAGNKQTFTPSSTTAGLRIIADANDPTVLSDGDIWYKSGVGLYIRIGSTSTPISGAGGGATQPVGGEGSLQYYVAGTPPVFGGNDDITRTESTTYTRFKVGGGSNSKRGVLRLAPRTGDFSADALNGDLWYSTDDGVIKAKQNNVVSALGISYDTTGQIPVALTRPREWDRHRMYAQAVPVDNNYRFSGFPGNPITKGIMTYVYDANGIWIQHTVAASAATFASAGLTTGHFEYVQARWLPSFYCRFALPSNFSSQSGNVIWIGLFGDALNDSTGAIHSSIATPDGLAVAAFKAVAGSGTFTTYTCSGSANITTGSGGTVTNGQAYECLIKFVDSPAFGVEFWLGQIGVSGMAKIGNTITTNVPANDTFMSFDASTYATTQNIATSLMLSRISLEFN